MRDGNQGRQRMPFRAWRRRPRQDAAAKLHNLESGAHASIVPSRVRIEVQGGRDASANMIRAYRVLRQVEESGGLGKIVEVAGTGSALIAEVDAAQAKGLAAFPFVRRIVSLN